MFFRFVSSFAFTCFLPFLHILSFPFLPLTFSLHTPPYPTYLLLYSFPLSIVFIFSFYAPPSPPTPPLPNIITDW
jgi:hypothetical protein